MLSIAGSTGKPVDDGDCVCDGDCDAVSVALGVCVWDPLTEGVTDSVWDGVALALAVTLDDWVCVWVGLAAQEVLRADSCAPRYTAEGAHVAAPSKLAERPMTCAVPLAGAPPGHVLCQFTGRKDDTARA